MNVHNDLYFLTYFKFYYCLEACNILEMIFRFISSTKTEKKNGLLTISEFKVVEISWNTLRNEFLSH